MMRYILAMTAVALFLTGPHGVAQVTSSDLPKSGAGQSQAAQKPSSVPEEKAAEAPEAKPKADPQEEPVPTPATPSPAAPANATAAPTQAAPVSQASPQPRVGRTEPRSTGGKRVAAFWMMLPGRS